MKRFVAALLAGPVDDRRLLVQRLRLEQPHPAQLAVVGRLSGAIKVDAAASLTGAFTTLGSSSRPHTRARR